MEMNRFRRKELEEAITLLSEAKDVIDRVREDEQEAFGNMPENFQWSDRGEQMEGYISTMEDALDSIDYIIGTITDEVIEA
jgi:hypothetical protein